MFDEGSWLVLMSEVLGSLEDILKHCRCLGNFPILPLVLTCLGEATCNFNFGWVSSHGGQPNAEVRS